MFFNKKESTENRFKTYLYEVNIKLENLEKAVEKLIKNNEKISKKDYKELIKIFEFQHEQLTKLQASLTQNTTILGSIVTTLNTYSKIKS